MTETDQITKSTFKEGDLVEVLVVPGSSNGIDRDALTHINKCLRAIVVAGEENAKPESCDFGMDEETESAGMLLFSGLTVALLPRVSFRGGNILTGVEASLFCGMQRTEKSHSQ